MLPICCCSTCGTAGSLLLIASYFKEVTTATLAHGPSFFFTFQDSLPHTYLWSTGSSVLRKHTHACKSRANNSLWIQFARSVIDFVSRAKVNFHFHFRALIQLCIQNQACISLESSRKGEILCSLALGFHCLLDHYTASCSNMSLLLLLYTI